MDTLGRIELPTGTGTAALGTDCGERGARVPLELLLVGMAAACAVLGALTDILPCAVVTSVVAVVITMRRIRMEVRDLRECEREQG